ncbi:MAG TPA: hypothetical protein PLI95_26350 [Polyangiaceae bacterium]|nr:hypothetical protein [Polyangiaceae bacterium]
MKTFLFLSLSALLCGCGASSPSPALAPNSPPSESPTATAGETPAQTVGGQEEQAQGCSRTLPFAGPAKEGDECGGVTKVPCAEGLTCMAKYRCLESIGTCKKK